MIRESPDRNTFQKNNYIKNKAKEGKTVDNDPDVKALVEWYETLNDRTYQQDPEWQKNNLEYDLRTNDMIAEKCKDNIYAQHLYAALCNNDFIKNDVWPLLQDQRWSCSWRHAGGIIADIKQEGDYIDWYCSGIRTQRDYIQEEVDMMTEDERVQYKEAMASVPEGTVTDEIRKDLLDLGWLVAELTE